MSVAKRNAKKKSEKRKEKIGQAVEKKEKRVTP